MKAAEHMKESMTPGRVYRAEELKRFSNNFTRDLKKLVERNEIVKAAAGLYYRPVMTRVGPLPASPDELVRAFLRDDDFLLSSLDDYNPLGLGLTQLYNETIVYNRKRHGRFVLDGRHFSFRRPRDFPRTLSKEFLFIEVMNNRKELADDTSGLETKLADKAKALDRNALAQAANRYGKVATRKFFQEIAFG